MGDNQTQEACVQTNYTSFYDMDSDERDRDPLIPPRGEYQSEIKEIGKLGHKMTINGDTTKRQCIKMLHTLQTQA